MFQTEVVKIIIDKTN